MFFADPAVRAKFAPHVSRTRTRTPSRTTPKCLLNPYKVLDTFYCNSRLTPVFGLLLLRYTCTNFPYYHYFTKMCKENIYLNRSRGPYTVY